MPLAAGKLAAVFADVGVPFIRQLFDKFVHIGEPCRRDYLFVRSVLATDTDIFQNTVVKQRHVLEHDGVETHQFFRVDFGHVHAAHGDFAPVNVPEPRCQAGNGGLAAAGWTDKRRNLSLFRRKGHIPKHRFAALIGEAHMVEYDVAILVGELFVAGLHRAI